jgi:hypothetical protein
MNYNEMAGVIERFVDGSTEPWEWEEYFLVMKYDDPFLRYFQQRVLRISFEFPSNSPGEYTSHEGLAALKELARELRSRTLQQDGL